MNRNVLKIGSFILIVLLVVFFLVIYTNYELFQDQYLQTHLDLLTDSKYINQTPTIKPMQMLSERLNDGILESDPYGNASYETIDVDNANKFLTAQVGGTCATTDQLLEGNLFILDSNSSWALLDPLCESRK
jgi:hypothetical protein